MAIEIIETIAATSSDREEVVEGGGEGFGGGGLVGEGVAYPAQEGETDARGGVLLVLLHKREELRLVLAVADRATVVTEHDLLELAEHLAERRKTL